MIKRQAMILGAFLVFCSLSIQAEAIGSAFGYSLGMPMSEVKVVSEVTLESGEKMKEVEAAEDGNLQRILVGTTSDDKYIARIMGESPPMAVADCKKQLSKTLEILRQRHSNSSYYALDDAEMIYEADKTIHLQCETTGNLSRLIIDYRDDKTWK